MRNKIMGRRKFTQLLNDGDCYIPIPVQDRAVKGDIIHIMEVGDDTPSPTGRFCNAVVQARVYPSNAALGEDRKIIKIKRLPIICPTSTVDDIWPEGTQSFVEKDNIKNVATCPCQR